MAYIGDIYLGGTESGMPISEHFASGIAFLLKHEAEIDYIYHPQDSRWQVEIKKNHYYAVYRSRDIQTYDNLILSGLENIQCCMDIIAVKNLGILILDHPEIDHIALFQRNKETILRFFSIATLPILVDFSVEVRDKKGNIKPPPIIPEPNWTWAFRYYRLSQASQDIFEAYRNLFLSLESLLNIIRPKLPKEGETRWLENAISEISTRVPLSDHIQSKTSDPIKYFMKSQYTDIRCRLFHAKYPDALLPYEELNPTDVLVAYEALLRLWRDIAGKYLHVPSGGGVVTYQGFKWWMDKLSNRQLSLNFTEDDSPPLKEDSQVSPLGSTIYQFERFRYLGETNPGIASWQGEINLLDIHRTLSIHRICSMIEKTLLETYYIKNGLSLSGVDVFETYKSIRLLNLSQPKTNF